MAKARALDKRRKSIRNIRKITRTMELIATARFKKAMDRATAATAYTRRITQVVSDLAGSGLKVTHPLLDPRPTTNAATLLVLTANRGLCGGYNASVIRQALARQIELSSTLPSLALEVSGKRGIGAFKFRKIPVNISYTQFEDQPSFEAVEQIANRYLEAYTSGKLDKLEVVYTKFVNASKQIAVTETLLPLGSLATGDAKSDEKPSSGESMYEFLPSAESILEEVVPSSFKVKLFKCFLDAAVSEQIARMVAMKSATQNASDMIKQLSMTYNRARQSQITGEIMEIIGGVEALQK
ncbi:ATP synthase F1, gamma subunit [Pirellula staleyi DSM 6068]|uniref:ATP synthase gamma chain n=1 Tax=Pirellula staleyi (strain ATCC 27377 / DSM 6068 / ICPB 4128) TaxID=530564 RepID=D2R5X3_PIRSD|nr:ATP synthase F1 subunit gamma [Pirellula staleyi]ADB19058.1 ATP synthase F1, gamma subunit [Pirellula staleyi DSM 6068]